MSSRLWAIHFAEWLTAVTLNAIVLLTIFRYSPKNMGKYPWLLAVYSLFNVAYTTLDVVVAPTPYIFGRTYMLSSYTWILRDERVINWLMILYCSGFSQLLCFLNFQFFYRYVVVCRSHWIPKMKPIPTTLCAIFLYIFVCGTWTLNSYVALNRDEEVFAKINDRYKNLTGRDVIGTGSITQAFEGVSLYVILRSYIGMLVYCLIMSVTSSFIVYCGWALKKSLQEEGKSTKTRNMQKELFKALIFQLLVPLATVYFPVSIFFLAALLGVDGWDTEIITIMVMFDPIIEPIVIIYFIKCYRRPIARLLCCGPRKVCGFWTQETNRYSTGETATKTSRNQIAPDVSQSKEAYSNASLRGNS